MSMQNFLSDSLFVISRVWINVLVTALSAFVPLIVGVGFTILMHFTKTNPVPKIIRYLTIPLESLVPVIVIVAVYYIPFPDILPFSIPFSVESIACCVIGLTLCFLAYMPHRYNENDSIIKNIAVNGLGLIASIFKWSTIVGYIAVTDIMRAAAVQYGRTYTVIYYIWPLIVSFIVLAVIYILKNILRDVLK